MSRHLTLTNRTHYGGPSPREAEEGWQFKARAEGIAEFMISFCELHNMACRVSCQDEFAGQVYLIRIGDVRRRSNGFYFPLSGTAAELVEDFQNWSRLYG